MTIEFIQLVDIPPQALTVLRQDSICARRPYELMRQENLYLVTDLDRTVLYL